MSYVYIQSEKPSADSDGLWTVGFYGPSGEWNPESDHSSAEAAAERVHWLNGGQLLVTKMRIEAGARELMQELDQKTMNTWVKSLSEAVLRSAAAA